MTSFTLCAARSCGNANNNHYPNHHITDHTGLGQVVDAANAAALSGKLLQLASGAIYDEHGETVEVHGAKLDALEDIIETANGQTVLVAYWFKHDLARIHQRFPAARELKTSADIGA